MRLDRKLPDEIAGVKIQTDFRSILRLLCAETDEEKGRAILEIFNGTIPENIGEEFNQFIAAGEVKEEDEDQPKSFDFVKDAGRIYSSFYSDYGINLFHENLHWWEFMELFKGLSENSIMKKVIEIRTKKLDDKMSKDEIAHWVEMKSLFALDDFEGYYSE